MIEIGLKAAGIVILPLAGGFLAGIFLSEVIGIVGMVIFQQPVGIKYLPVYLALLSAGATLLVMFAARRKAG